MGNPIDLAWVKSNIWKFDRRGKDRAEMYKALQPEYRRYFDRALATEAHGPRRRELLAERAAMFPGKGRRNPNCRLRECRCGRLYQADTAVRNALYSQFCPGCRSLWRKTPAAAVKRALFNPARRQAQLRRMREALGDFPAPQPQRCEHGACQNDSRLKKTWLHLDRPPRWLCPRHRWRALKDLRHAGFNSLPVGRPKRKRRRAASQPPSA